jgi:hypothetical protein
MIFIHVDSYKFKTNVESCLRTKTMIVANPKAAGIYKANVKTAQREEGE